MLFRSTKRVAYLEQNVYAQQVQLTTEEKHQISTWFAHGVASGTRYPEAAMKGLGI